MHAIFNTIVFNNFEIYQQELVPFLTESVDDEDEVLVALAIALGKLIPFVGGKQYAYVILQPLELLLTVGKNIPSIYFL